MKARKLYQRETGTDKGDLRWAVKYIGWLEARVEIAEELRETCEAYLRYRNGESLCIDEIAHRIRAALARLSQADGG